MEAIEVRLQRGIEDFLVTKGLYPWQTLYCSNPVFLKITFMTKDQWTEFLDYVEYKSLADKSGVEVCPDGFTVIIRGIALKYFLGKIESEENEEST